MTLQLTTEQVWQAIEKELFAVIGMVTAGHEARTVGVVYVARDRKLYIGTRKDAWKARHIAGNPHVSLTIPLAKRIPFLPWIKIPAATITFSGAARVLPAHDTPPDILQAVFRGLAEDEEMMADSALIEVTPEKEFITYGVGVSLMTMRHPEKARGRAPVGIDVPRHRTLPTTHRNVKFFSIEEFMAKTYRLTPLVGFVNRLMRLLIRWNVAPSQTYLLTVPGRKTGHLYSTPVSLVQEEGQCWLVSPYGQVSWVKNARAAGQVTLSRGQKSETVSIQELGPQESAPVLQQYLRLEKIVQPYFEVTLDSPLEAFIAEAPRHPVFLIVDALANG
ncbi:MAG: nitroreductase family deazaflavin-dependent oxidoreductase [Chloroflexota bacterium]